MLRSRALALVDAHIAAQRPYTGRGSRLELVLRGLDEPLVRAFAGFCARAGMRIGAMSVSGPAGLPMAIRRWSVLSSPFVHKTAWTQFERRMHRRALILHDMPAKLVKPYLWYVSQHSPPDVQLHCNATHRFPIASILEDSAPETLLINL